MSSIIKTYNNLVRQTRDEQIIQLYKNTIPKKMYDQIVENFSVEKFSGTFTQVATSRSTLFSRTGLTSSNVKAIYGKVETDENNVSVKNMSMDGSWTYRFIDGVSRPRYTKYGQPIVGCRTVSFIANPEFPNQTTDFEGDYWVLYATEDLNHIVVGAPIILFGTQLVNNFGLYVLSKDPETFWNTPSIRNDLLYYITGDVKFNPENNANKLRLEKTFNTWYNKPFASAESYYPSNVTMGSQQ